MIISDLLTVYDEKVENKPMTLVDPDKNWVTKTISDYKVENIRVKKIENGNVIYKLPNVNATRKRVQKQLKTLWEEAKRLENPHTYVVNLSDKLTKTKEDLLKNYNS